MHYHFITCLCWAPTTGVSLFANGDNASARGGSLNRYTDGNLTATKTCGVLEITRLVKG